jgi:hypothetical protein
MTSDSISPFKPEYRSLFGEALQPPLTERHETRLVLLAYFPHESGNDDAVGFSFAA